MTAYIELPKQWLVLSQTVAIILFWSSGLLGCLQQFSLASRQHDRDTLWLVLQSQENGLHD